MGQLDSACTSPTLAALRLRVDARAGDFFSLSALSPAAAAAGAVKSAGA
jgi:hypothetical protein